MSKKKKILFAVGGIAAVAALILFYENWKYVTTDDAQVDAHTVLLAAKVPGYITSVTAEDGKRVSKGELLVQIDERDYQNTVKQLSAELLSAEARKLEAEKNYKRLSELFKTGVVSQQQYEQISSVHSDTKAKFDALSAQVAQAQLNLDSTKIVAPFDGIVSKKSAEVGQLASAGVPLVGFVEANQRWVVANFKETEIEGLVPGQKVDIEVDAITSHKFVGQVAALSPATGATFTLLPPDNATGNFTKVVQRVPVKIRLLDLNPKDLELLRAGLSAYVKVHKH